jgi:hypothetical protein
MEDGVAYSMKELTVGVSSLTKNLNGLIDGGKKHNWYGIEGYIKIPFSSYTNASGSNLPITQAYIENWIYKQFRDKIRVNA